MTQPSQLDLTCGKKILLVFEKSHLALIKITLIDALFIFEMVKKLKKRFNFRLSMSNCIYCSQLSLHWAMSCTYSSFFGINVFLLSPSWMEN